MAEPIRLVRIPTLKTISDFRGHVASLGITLPCEDQILAGTQSPLAQPIADLLINNKQIGNRFAVQAMEGWDGTTTGGITDEVTRRWQRFGESGAKLIYGGEAMAVRPDGRANPNQLIINEQNKAGLATVRETLVKAHQDRFGKTDDLVIGFQLTHSGRFCKPTDKFRMEPRVAYRHPVLDPKFKVTSDSQVWTDEEIERLILDYIAAAKVAWEAGADFVDIKHCHGYLLHEFLSAFTRPGKYGGSFENRTRILREIISGIRASGNKIEFGVRLSAFDFVPFKPDPTLSRPGKLGPGIPEDFSRCLPYCYGFGTNQQNPIAYDLTEVFHFRDLCAQLGVKIVNLSAGSPYYNPHIQRPAAYPPSDGYQPPEDPLVGVARQINVVRELKASAPKGLVIVGTAYSYLQEYLPHVAQYVIRNGWTDMVGLGRMVLSYPGILADAVEKGALATKSICRTFSDCTTAPRNGMISGCYPLDKYYSAKPEFQKLKEVKKAVGA
ncbi:MAG TPA: NADH:flavin oxidoreductase [Candidatus Dormibacteraeota bacterium]|nr:NADH:flavin oxidoreductase [Candidatus Dormibacteraeota bacterium]